MVLAICFPWKAMGQNFTENKITVLPSYALEKKDLKGILTERDSSLLVEKLRKYSNKAFSKGFTSFSVDTFYRIDSRYAIELFFGSRYFLKAFEIDSLPPADQSTIEYNFDKKKLILYDKKNIELKLNRILINYQNNGFPFAAFKQPKINFSLIGKDSIGTEISYTFNRGQLIVFDSLEIVGKKKESARFINNLVRFKKGSLFSQEQIYQIPVLLNNSIYFDNVDTPKVVFSKDKANLLLTVNQRKSNRFDGLLGFLPPLSPGEKSQIVALFDLQLVSAFHGGEVIGFRYDRLPNTSQKLNLSFIQPFFLQTPFRIEGEFFLQKQDSSFLSRSLKASGGIPFGAFILFKGIYRNLNSGIIDARPFNTNTTLPAVLDSKSNMFGFGFTYENLDYKYNPRKGWVVSTDFTLGRKKVKQNPGLDSLSYTDIILDQPKREMSLSAHYYHKIGKYLVLYLGNQTFWIDQIQYFQNDLRQVGGARMLRGFNENQFFASFFSMGTLEFRMILDRNSNIYTFTDIAYLETKVGTSFTHYTPIGLGLGMNFDTKAGILNIAFGSGQFGDTKFNPARPKVHIGITNVF